MDKSGLQATMIYLVSHMGLIFFLYPSDLFGGMETGHWIGILLSYGLHMIAIFLYLKGMQMASHQNVMDIFRSAGKVIAWTLLLPAFVYMIIAFTITIRAYSEMITLVFLSTTPVWAIMLLFILIAFLMAWQGIASIARTSVLLVILFTLPILFVLCLSFQNVDWYYLLPFIEHNQSFGFITNVNFQVSLFVYAGGFFFLGLLPPAVHISIKKMMLGVLLLLPMFLVAAYLPLLTFGHATAKLYEFPVLMTIDTVRVTWLMFDRITILFFLSLMSFALLYLGLTLWGLVTLSKRAVPYIRDPYLLIGLTIGLYTISIAIPNWDSLEHVQVWIIPIRLYNFLAIPLLTFIFGWRLKRKSNRKAEVTE